MTRKNWSNFFLLLAAVDLAAGMLPHNPIRILDWIVLPAFITLGALARRRMI